MTSDALNWQIEQACFNAWPSPRQVILDGWALRSSGGPTRRTNSANPLHAGAQSSERFIDRVEAFYRRQGRRAMFRIPDMAGGIDAALDVRGYATDARTRTLFGPLDGFANGPDNLAITPDPGETWLAARDRVSGVDAEAVAAYRAIIGVIALPCGFASLSVDGQIASLAFGVLQDDLLVVESVMTDATMRGRGLARQCLSGLFGWARGQGARSAALQVMADNAPAVALYQSLGIARDLYGYHYRIAPAAQSGCDPSA
ncbi:GNAT family N-acetyltransferase [Sphingobium nicotianae]|uniref:GNAT family N-acetyltransferase n=1 Tax=Sphingobium nicotianae TaxID=2782607 RepID=A0A9X1AK52_9SPHN|nr:GNAT family N-acetyltransferase [Sphingobium nicotianae]MBT2185760.1 GNAT family N-acetyltransferase [Sphingobium nicotianae]